MNFFGRAIVTIVIVLTTAPVPCAQSGRQGNKAPPSAYDKAFALLQQGESVEALAEIDTALSASPDDPSLNNLRGLVTAKLNRNAEAEASFRKVIRLRPQAAMGYNNLAALLWQLGRSDEAVQSFRQALIHEPVNFAALVGIGTILSAQQKYAEALAYLENAWSIHSGDFQAGYELARALQETKRPAQAQRVLGRLSPPHDRTIAAKFYALQAGIAEQLGDRSSASRDYRRAYELSGQPFEIYLSLVRTTLAARDKNGAQIPPAPPGLSAEQNFTLGALFASSGDYSEAISYFQNTLRLEPANYAAAYNLALAYKQAGSQQAASELIEQTLGRQPTAELYSLLASVQEETGRYVEAARNYQRAVDLDPGNEEYYFDLGAEYLVHLTFEPAIEVFRIGTHKFPKSARQYVGIGLAQFALRRYGDAADAFLNALEMNPSSPDAFLAWNALPAFVLTAEWEKIQPRLKLIAERFPGSAQALFCYGAAVFRRSVVSEQEENFQLAQALLERAVHLDPKLAAAHLELATLYAQRNLNKQAVASFLEAIRLDPDSETAHYRLAQTYRNQNQLERANQELDLYGQLSRHHREQLAQTRSAIRQFVLAHGASEPVVTEKKPPL